MAHYRTAAIKITIMLNHTPGEHSDGPIPSGQTQQKPAGPAALNKQRWVHPPLSIAQGFAMSAGKEESVNMINLHL